LQKKIANFLISQIWKIKKKEKKTPMIHGDFLVGRVINDCNYCIGNQVNCLMIIHNIYNKLGVHNFASKEVRTRSLIKTKTHSLQTSIYKTCNNALKGAGRGRG
jgi:Na+-transporting NADH:ubiquinone oxidoreductase subunit NqrA